LIKNKGTITIFFDGSSRGNPGHSGAGAIVFRDGEVIALLSKYIGEGTNNVAEYRALKEVLMKIESLVGDKSKTVLLLRSDSELVVNQITGRYKIKNDKLRGLYGSIVTFLNHYKDWYIESIPREKNKTADALANAAVDNAMRGMKKRR
jgi:ribonuclease HI